MLTMIFLPAYSFAAQMGIEPWEVILNKLTQSITGPVAYSMSILAITVSMLTLAFADLQGGAKRFVQVSVAFSVIFFAGQIVTGLYMFSGAVI